MCVFTFWLAFVIFAFFLSFSLSLIASEFIIVRLTYINKCVSFTMIIIMQTHKKKNNKINKLITCYIDYFLTSSLYFRLLVKVFARKIKRTRFCSILYKLMIKENKEILQIEFLNLLSTLEGTRSASVLSVV